MSATDAERVALIRSGDRKQFAALFAEYYPGLRDYAQTILGSVHAAEEVVDDVFVWVWEHRANWVPVGSSRVYLYRAVRNRALNAIRSESALDATHTAAYSHSEYTDASPELADERVEIEETAAVIWDVVNTLPNLARQVLTLRYRHQMQWIEVAETLGLSEAAVQMHHTRAFRALRERFPRHLR